MRRAIRVLVVLGAMLGAFLATSQVASATPVSPATTGGGCSGYLSAGYGSDQLNACISASGGSIKPDGYVKLPNRPAGCQVKVELIALGIGTVTEAVNPCSATSGAHVAGAWAPIVTGRQYVTWITITSNGTTVSGAVLSPKLYT